MLGQTVSHYRIVKKLGQGGMGVVYEAEDLLLGRHVAIKFLTDARREPQFRARFLREARAASTLSHPHIAVIYDYGEVREGDPFIVMELVSGQSLDHLLSAGEPLPITRAVEIAEQVAEALAEAHSHGVVHRDIKPSNIIIDENGAVKVLDFGLAKQLQPETLPSAMLDSPTLLDAHTASNVIIGTPTYLSPEQAMAAPVDGRSDLFALGSVLYECLTGRPAFRGATIVEICAQVLHVDPPPPSQLNPRVPPELDALVLKVLNKQPAARHQTATELLSALRAVRTLPPSADQHAKTRSLSGLYTTALSGVSNIRRINWRAPRFFIPLLLSFIVAGALAWRVIPNNWLNHRSAPAISDEARKWYERGTDALRDGSYFQASKILEHTISLADEYALAHARLAEALMELDYTDRARDAILRAESLERERPGLPESDRFYLTAINAAVRRDFPAAIKAYAALAGLGQNKARDKAQVYIDLGRAYEKNDEIDKAIENYTKATNLSQEFAAPFLRLGVLYGRKQELASADGVFAKAEAIYQRSNNLEGVAEVHLQRGILANRLRRTDEAREHLQRALELARANNHKYPQIIALIELSNLSLNKNDLPRAQQLASEAVEGAQAEQMETLQPRALIASGSVYFVNGESGKAEEIFKKALASAQRYAGRRNEATAKFMLGSLAIQNGQTDEGLRYAEQARDFYQKGGYRNEAAQALVLIGRASHQRGDYKAALQAYTQQIEIAQRLNNAAQQGLAHEAIGYVLSLQEDYPEALSHFEQTSFISKRLNDKIGLGYGLMNQGKMLWRLGRYQDARSAFEQSLIIANQSVGGNKALLAAIYQHLAGMSLSELKFSESKDKGEQALALAGAQETNAVAELKRIICLAQIASGAKPKGHVPCEESLAIATRLRDPYQIAKSLLSLAEASLANDDAAKALETALQAQAKFTAAEQRESEWRAWLVAARASQRAGDERKAGEYAARAAAALSQLQQQWGMEAFNRYLSRKDVQLYRKQLDQSSGRQ